TYVHGKAGRSRSIAAVVAYLIHANHWALSRAYRFVVGRRRAYPQHRIPPGTPGIRGS
ncbi:hypothetical protein SCLCIDRAFT_131893, partial [Scleroderma citrinum Foug A]